jgi:hypothetical protein
MGQQGRNALALQHRPRPAWAPAASPAGRCREKPVAR